MDIPTGIATAVYVMYIGKRRNRKWVILLNVHTGLPVFAFIAQVIITGNTLHSTDLSKYKC
jgi:hypothetical protein